MLATIRKQKKMKRKTKNNSKEKIHKHPHHEKSKRRLPGDRRLAFRVKSSFYSIKGGSAEGGVSHRKESEANSFAFIRR